jgi:hypothetical protein
MFRTKQIETRPLDTEGEGSMILPNIRNTCAVAQHVTSQEIWNFYSWLLSLPVILSCFMFLPLCHHSGHPFIAIVLRHPLIWSPTTIYVPTKFIFITTYTCHFHFLFHYSHLNCCWQILCMWFCVIDVIVFMCTNILNIGFIFVD